MPADIEYVWPVRSPAVLDRERKKEENARLRQQRTEQKILDELARAKRKRSAAAKKAARTRAANAEERARAAAAPPRSPSA